MTEYSGRYVLVPVLTGPLHTVEGDDLPPLDASDPRFGTGITTVRMPVEEYIDYVFYGEELKRLNKRKEVDG